MQNHTLATLPQRQVQRRTGSSQQNRKIWWTVWHAHLLPSCHRNRRYRESVGCWACPGNWQTDHIDHWRTQRIHLSVSADVNSPPKGKCGRLPQHFWLRLDAVADIPSYTMLSLRLCAIVGEKIFMQYNVMYGNITLSLRTLEIVSLTNQAY